MPQKSRDRFSQRNRGPKNFYICSVFRGLRDLMANVLQTKRDVDNRAKALGSRRSHVHRSKISWTLVHKWVNMEPEFSSTLYKFCVLLRCHTLHTEVSKRNPTKLCQTEGGKWRWCEPNIIILYYAAASCFSKYPNCMMLSKLNISSRWVGRCQVHYFRHLSGIYRCFTIFKI